MKITIAMLSYNEKQYIGDAIESCLRQTCDYPFEIIIGDDGSTDGSIELIEAYRKKYPEIIRYFVMDRSDAVDVIPSIRVSNLIKRAYAQARGDYLAILSGDDLILEADKFAKQVGFLENNPDYVACYSDFKLFWPDGQEKEIVMHSSISSSTFWGMWYMHLSCWIFRKSVLKYMLDRFCDDIGLIFSILKAGKAKHIPGISFGYRQRDKSIMHASDPMELKLLELCVYQDTLNETGFKLAGYCRFWGAVKWVWEHRNQLSEQKYAKYRRSCAQYPNDIIEKIAKYDQAAPCERRKMWLYVKCGWILLYAFRAWAKVECRLPMNKD